MNDIKRWVDGHGGGKDDRIVYSNDIHDLLLNDSYEAFEKMLRVKELKWSEAFGDYFRSRILPRVASYGLWSVNKTTATTNPITTNQSEGFNTLLKSLQGWKEVPLDVVLLSIQMLQKYFYNEIARGRAGLGNFTLKEVFADLAIPVEQLANQPTVAPDKIALSIQGKEFMAQDEPTPVYSNVKYTQAREIISKDMISFSARLGVFTVSGESLETIHLIPETCSCPARNNCVHILAVKLALGLDLDKDKVTLKKRNLQTLRKNAREGRSKPGRKQPRKGDVEVIPAPDSMKSKQDDLEPLMKHPRIETIPEESVTEEPIPVSASTPVKDLGPIDLSLKKDIKYSVTVWIPASDIYPTDLSVKDRDLIKDGDGWLNDIIIDFSMAILKLQFPAIDGLESCLEVGACRAPPVQGPALQIINTDPVGAGSHWILLSSLNCDEGRVQVFDSAGGSYLRLAALRSLAYFFRQPPHVTMIGVNWMECDSQTNGSDCGVFALANAVALCHGLDPSEIHYIVPEMRSHLVTCMESRRFTPFPYTEGDHLASSQKVRFEKLYCSCKVPEDSHLYFECSVCEEWFHPECQGLGQKKQAWLNKQKNLKCTKCNVTKKGKKRRR